MKFHTLMFVALATPLIAIADDKSDNSAPAIQQKHADAGRIALVSDFPDRGGLFVMDADGGNLKRLTKNGMCLLPTWSPDGKLIAYLSLREADFNPKYDVAFQWPLFVIDVQTGKAQKITSAPIGMVFQWSPDGKKFVFQSSHEDQRNQGKEGVVSSAIYVMDRDGTNQKRLTSIEEMNGSPSWSPDGNEIHFKATEAGSTIAYFMKPDGSGLKKEATKAGVPLPPAKRLISVEGEIHVVDADGSKKKLTSKDEEATDYVLSADGTRIFYRAQQQGKWGLFTVEIDGKNRKRLAPDVGNVTGFALSGPPNRSLAE